MRSNSNITFNLFYIHCMVLIPWENKLIVDLKYTGSVALGVAIAAVHLFNTSVQIKICGQLLDGFTLNLAET